MMLFRYIVFFVLLIVGIRGEDHFYAHGPFGKPHLKAEIPSLFNCNRSIGVFSRSIRSLSVTITELNVSSTHYSNKDSLYVTWTPTTAPCKDDFIGIYFVEIPTLTGHFYCLKRL
jgi:hypothetical protein